MPMVMRGLNNAFNIFNHPPAQIAGYIQELLTQSGLQLNMGLVQTAYANGSSTKYAIETLVSTVDQS